MTRTSPAETAPRYTSYPTTPHFHAGITGQTVAGWIGEIGADEKLSLYLHIPFCDRLCWFCACHTRHTLRYEPVAAYLGVLHREIGIVARHLGGRGRVVAVHLGGGSPTMLRPGDLKALIDLLRRSFRFDPRAEIAIEIDPSDVDPQRLDSIAAVGTTRASLGVQDFEPVVQKAINREQGYELTRDIVEGLRARGIGSINLDLVYGLPHQTVETVSATVDACLSLKPDRLALFGYAHVPWFKKHQTMIDETVLPGPEERLQQAQAAARRIVGAGYEAVGIDHFARPSDSLATALRDGTLRRNFQGYTDDGCETLIGLGPSAISRFRQGHAQNPPAMAVYTASIDNGMLPAARGIALSAEDRVRGWVIERLMCDFGFPVGELLELDAEIGATVCREADRIAYQAPDTLRREAGRFAIPPAMQPFARSVAARFDPYFAKGTARHSAAV